jgi:putative membrane protein
MGSVPLMHATWGGWPWLAPLWILLWIVVIATVIRFFAGRRGGWCGPYGSRRGPGASEILAERFARGEIDASEFQSRRDALRQ